MNIFIGLLSAVVDNGLLVAASLGMYPLEMFSPDYLFWQFHGEDNVRMVLKKIAPLALIGYLSGAGIYLLQQHVLG
jgi:hypothetical protein